MALANSVNLRTLEEQPADDAVLAQRPLRYEYQQVLLRELRCDQSHIMALTPQGSTKKVSPGEGFHPDQRSLHVRSEHKALILSDLLIH